MSNVHDEGPVPVFDHLIDGSGSNQPEAGVNTVPDASRAPPHQESTKAPSNEQSTGPREPSALYEMLQHPLLMRNVVLPTTAVAEVITKVRGAAMLREHSICFSGPSGSGKSQALRGVAIELPKRFPDVSVFTHNILNQPVNSTRAFFKHFLVTTRAGSTAGETYDLRDRLANRLLEEALQSKLKLVVMLVDESQQMTLEDFNFLKDIGNHLEFYNAHILVVMMAEEPSFQEVVSMLSHTDRKGISCRFILNRYALQTVRTLEDYERLFALLDQQIYPTGTNTSWPQFFAPINWRNGFRMQEQAKFAFADVERRLGVAYADQAVNLRQLFIGIRKLMLALTDLELCGKAWTPELLWKEVLDGALLEDAAKISATSAAPKGRSRVRL